MACLSSDKGEKEKQGSGNDTTGTTCNSPSVCHFRSDDSHALHIDGLRGPGISEDRCDVCHQTNSPTHGDAAFLDGLDLEATTACDACHSPLGAYNGVRTAGDSLGAKEYWAEGVYEGNALRPGKEKWCVGCHDEAPSIIKGVSAPAIAGDATTFGYYVSGHGRTGVAQGCEACHDAALSHIDGDPRTYAAPAGLISAGSEYRAGYRLKRVQDLSPMVIPYLGNYDYVLERRTNTASIGLPAFRLCFSCHEALSFADASDRSSNFRDDTEGVNDHFRHLALTMPDLSALGATSCLECHPTPGASPEPWDSDGDGIGDSQISCPACHNVHGSRSPSMIRTGELLGSSGGLAFRYLESGEGEAWRAMASPDLGSSTGGALDLSPVSGALAAIQDNGVCLMCHDQRIAYYRSPAVP